jgi:hypothetical protein
MLEGYKTYLVAVLMAVLPVVTESVAGIDWVTVLTGWGVPQAMVVPVAGLVAAAVMAVMRKVTEATTVKTALETEPPK